MSNLVIATNVAGLNTHRSLKTVSGKSEKASERLSSGYKINRAADDAAGLAISEKMRNQIKGLNMAQKNCEDGNSLLNVMDAGMSEIHEMLKRQRELIIQSMNDTNTESDRQKIQTEIDQLTCEIYATATKSEFNTQPLLDRAAEYHIHMPGYPKTIVHESNFVLENAAPDNDRQYSVSPSTQAALKSGTVQKGLVDLAEAGDEWVAGDEIEFDWEFAVQTQRTPTIVTPGLQSNTITNPNTGLSETYVDTPLYSFPTGQYVYPDIVIEAPNPNDGRLEMTWDWNTGSYNVVDYTFADGFEINVGGYKIPEYLSVPADPSYGPSQIAVSINGTFKHTDAGDNATFNGELNDLTLPKYDAPWSVVLENKSMHKITNSAHSRVTGYAETSPGVWELQRNVVNYNRTSVYYDSNIVKADSDVDIMKHTYPHDPLYIQAGANEDQGMLLDRYDCRPYALGLVTFWGEQGLVTSPADEAEKSLVVLDNAIATMSTYRANEGAQRNRLEHTIAALGISSENLSASESRIRDTDMAKEMMEFTKANILSQAGMSMLAQANQTPNQVLSIIR